MLLRQLQQREWCGGAALRLDVAGAASSALAPNIEEMVDADEQLKRGSIVLGFSRDANYLVGYRCYQHMFDVMCELEWWFCAFGGERLRRVAHQTVFRGSHEAVAALAFFESRDAQFYYAQGWFVEGDTAACFLTCLTSPVVDNPAAPVLAELPSATINFTAPAASARDMAALQTAHGWLVLLTGDQVDFVLCEHTVESAMLSEHAGVRAIHALTFAVPSRFWTNESEIVLSPGWQGPFSSTPSSSLPSSSLPASLPPGAFQMWRFRFDAAPFLVHRLRHAVPGARFADYLIDIIEDDSTQDRVVLYSETTYTLDGGGGTASSVRAQKSPLPRFAVVFAVSYVSGEIDILFESAQNFDDGSLRHMLLAYKHQQSAMAQQTPLRNRGQMWTNEPVLRGESLPFIAVPFAPRVRIVGYTHAPSSAGVSQPSSDSVIGEDVDDHDDFTPALAPPPPPVAVVHAPVLRTYARRRTTAAS